MGPGATPLTRIPLGPSCLARDFTWENAVAFSELNQGTCDKRKLLPAKCKIQLSYFARSCRMNGLPCETISRRSSGSMAANSLG
jgi:hypothetical protein